MCICSVILGQLESFRKTKHFSIIFSKILDAIQSLTKVRIFLNPFSIKFSNPNKMGTIKLQKEFIRYHLRNLLLANRRRISGRRKIFSRLGFSAGKTNAEKTGCSRRNSPFVCFVTQRTSPQRGALRDDLCRSRLWKGARIRSTYWVEPGTKEKKQDGARNLPCLLRSWTLW